jgi:penicillin-binding protein 1A
MAIVKGNGATFRRTYRATEPPSRPPGRDWRRLLAKIAIWLGGMMLLGYALLWFFFARGLPSEQMLLEYRAPLPTIVRDVDGMPVASFARERRVALSYDEFPPQLVHAFISAEDKTFFTHGGLDYPGIAAAIIHNWRNRGTDKRPRGASTITQQVAKNLLANSDVKISRKIREAILAKRIESAFTKQQIMELYLNGIFLGRNAYGVQAASRAYFAKDVKELDLAQLAFLAILPKAPANYNPDRFNDRAVVRRNWVLGEMMQNGYITAAQRDAARAEPLVAVIPAVARAETALPGNSYIEAVRRDLLDRYGETADDGPYSVYAGGLWVRTSLDSKLQAAAEQALRDGLIRYEGGGAWNGPGTHIDPGPGWQGRLAAANYGTGYANWLSAVVLSKDGGVAQIGFMNGSTGLLPAATAAMPRRGTTTSAYNAMRPGDVIAVKQDGGHWALKSVPVVSGAFVAEDPHTGRVLAMVGGFDARGSAFNRATQAQRQPGSSFKPFVYAAALDHGMTPATMIVDGPFCVFQSAYLGSKCFRNFSGGYAGPRTMRWGVEQSRNLMTVRAAAQTGMTNVVATAKAMGIGTYPAVLAIALGAGETTVSRMVNGYSMLANGGKWLDPTVIDLIQDRNGKTIYRADTRPCPRCNARDWNGGPMPRPPLRTKQVMDPMTAYQVVHILEGVVQRGTATTLRSLNRPLFGKTGTTSGPTNVWFVGGSPDLVAGVYLGYDHPRPLGGRAQGGTVAAPIFKQFAQVAMRDMPIVPFKAAPGIRMVRIDRRSGRRVFGTWPTTDPKAAVIWEAFKPESEPRRTIRREELVNQVLKPTQGPTMRSDSEFLLTQGGIY